jgi:hypothetical protein
MPTFLMLELPFHLSLFVELIMYENTAKELEAESVLDKFLNTMPIFLKLSKEGKK